MKHWRRYSGAYVRGSLYAAIAFLTGFVAEFEPLKVLTSEQIGALTPVFWALVWGKIFLGTAVTMRAFFDGTVERASTQAIPDEPKSTS